MTILNIPVPGTTDAFTESLELDGTIYELKFRWNARDRHWMLDVITGGDLLMAGIKLVISDDLLARDLRPEGLPPGRLFVADLDNLDRDPEETLFGDRVLLRYEPLNA